MGIELVILDMAGTTVKDNNYVGTAFQNVMECFDYPISIEEINLIMGYEKSLAIRMMLEKHEQDKSKITKELVSDIHKKFVASMINFYETSDDIIPLPNVESTFAILRERGVKVAINTGFSKDIADVIIRRLNWENQIDALVASDEVERGRPFPDMIEKIKMALGIKSQSSECVAKVGDTEADIKEGINSGCKYVIGITTGSFTREGLQSYGPTHVIDDISEIISIIFDAKK